jgi:2-oxoisovalerate dehydrogenase E2 component (dihydrolipoyl transacylase)
VVKVASEHNVDLSRVEGTGRGGRVTRADVVRVVEQAAEDRDASAQPETVELPATTSRQAEPETEAGPDLERVRLTPTRRTIARHMTQSHQTIPAVWRVVEADVTNLVALRNRVVDELEREEGVRLTYFPLFVHEIVAALRQHPFLNATYTDEAIEVHRRYHMGIAMAAESGLIVPVVRDADRKSPTELARELGELGGKARERKLTVEELHGATFTIDNTGAFGSVISHPIIPAGQVAIITTEVIRRELRVADDGSFSTRSVISLCISFDHRALDGAQAGQFMRAVKERLENVRPDAPLR